MVIGVGPWVRCGPVHNISAVCICAHCIREGIAQWGCFWRILKVVNVGLFWEVLSEFN